jgi:dipeptidyl aminopeptidase/acylaminoacyl peptidase
MIFNNNLSAAIFHSLLILLSLVAGHNIQAQQSIVQNKTAFAGHPHILSQDSLNEMLKEPASLKGYKPLQSGPLLYLDSVNGNRLDTTYSVENIKIKSEGFLINGWLYLPLSEGPYPLIILTNGGGGDNRPIKSLSDFIAPVFAHCGIAAFVHDKRGTGESEGIFRETSYEDYINDAGNCAVFLSSDPRIDSTRIGVFGGSEGGRVAVVAASRFDVFDFVISMVGTMVSMVDDRFYAQTNALRNYFPDSLVREVEPLWMESFEAWASNDPSLHERLNQKIFEYRNLYPRGVVPFPKAEMDTIPAYEDVLSTWNSLGYDYLTEMKDFRKPWLAIYGAEDMVVPWEASIRNIIEYMTISGNKDYTIAIIPDCGHAPVSSVTGQRIRFENIILNWIAREQFAVGSNSRQ